MKKERELKRETIICPVCKNVSYWMEIDEEKELEIQKAERDDIKEYLKEKAEKLKLKGKKNPRFGHFFFY